MSSSVLTLGDRRLSLAAILASAFGVGLTFGMATPLVSLMLEGRGHGSVAIGVVAAGFSLAVLASGPFVPDLLRRAGAVRALIWGTLATAAALAATPFAGALAVIFLLRFLMGAGGGVAWIASETWINSLPDERSRGRVVAIYTTVWGAGLAGGPVILNLTGTAGTEPFLVAAGILAAAIVPVIAARRLAPPMGRTAGRKETPGGRLGAVFAAAPAALAAGFLGGFCEGAVFALFPVHALASGYDAGGAVLLMSAFAAGGIALQVPVGWLADRTERRRLAAAIAAVSIGCVVAVPWALGQAATAWPVLFLWGGAAAAFYTIGLILLGARFGGGGDLANANTAFIMTYTLGMISGPMAGGAAMAAWPSFGLLATIGAIYVVYLAALLRRPRPQPAEAD